MNEEFVAILKKNPHLNAEDIKKTRAMANESLSRPKSWYTSKFFYERDRKEAEFQLKLANYWEKKLNENKNT